MANSLTYIVSVSVLSTVTGRLALIRLWGGVGVFGCDVGDWQACGVLLMWAHH